MNHKFCETCGKELVSKYVFDHYDRRNGGRLYRKQYYCPARRWWNAFLHDSYFVHNNGFVPTIEYYTENYIRLTQRVPDAGDSGE